VLAHADALLAVGAYLHLAPIDPQSLEDQLRLIGEQRFVLRLLDSGAELQLPQLPLETAAGATCVQLEGVAPAHPVHAALALQLTRRWRRRLILVFLQPNAGGQRLTLRGRLEQLNQLFFIAYF